MNPKVGEVWRWKHKDEDHPSYDWDDLLLMIANDFPNCVAFLAIDLEHGRVVNVFPAYSPEDWERVL